MAKDARLPMRLPEALKDEFQWAAEQEGFNGVSAWLRALGEDRLEQLQTGRLPRTPAATAAMNHEHVSSGPMLDAFVPGFGLNEED